MIDAHAHLTDPRLAGDIEAVIARAEARGVARILTCGEDVTSSQGALGLARGHPVVRAAVGVHPHRAASCDRAALELIASLASDRHVVAVGEIGMDLSGRSAPVEDQERALASQLGLARELDLPVCVHVREAGDPVRAAIERVGGVRGHVHCYSEGAEEVGLWIRRGFAISFAGTVTYPKNEGLRAAAALVPIDHLLVESDAPYLAAQPHRGSRNEPSLIRATYEAIARARGIATEELVVAVGRNAAALFGPRWSSAAVAGPA